MKILQLCKKYPHPPKDGEIIAVTNLSNALHQLGAEVHGLVMNTARHPVDEARYANDLPQYTRLESVRVNNTLNPLDAALALARNQSYHITRFVSETYRAKLISILRRERFDVVQLETVFLAPYIPTIRTYAPDARIALRSHNVEHEIWQRQADNAPLLPKGWYLKILARQLRRYEVAQLKNVDLLVPISSRDRRTLRQLGYAGPAQTTPIGIDARDYRPDATSFDRTPSVSFIGSLDWMPNQEGLCWFLDKIWGRIERAFPDLHLHVGGRNTPQRWLGSRRASVTFHGEVPCAKRFLNQHSLSVVPLLSGSGMRAKILEAMALGKVVITTAIGLEGIDARNREEVLIANTPAEFEAAFAFALANPKHLREMGRRARQFVEERYDNLHIGRALMEAYELQLPRRTAVQSLTARVV